MQKQPAPGRRRPEDWLDRDDNARRYDCRRTPSPREQEREETLAAWLGPERHPEVFADLRPAPRKAADIVDEMLQRLPRRDIFVLNQVRRNWRGLVGDANARQTRPVFLRDGLLVVEVANPTWRYMLERQQKPLLLQRLAQFSRNEIGSLRFIPPGHSY